MSTRALYQYSLKREKVNGISDKILTSNPSDVVKFLHGIGLNEEEQECLIVLVLGVRNNVRGYYMVTRGLVDQSLAHPREVFRYAVINNASSIVLAHNHPSGHTSPSLTDMQLTEKLQKAGNLIGIRLVDHIIITENSHFSFAQRNMLKNNE